MTARYRGRGTGRRSAVGLVVQLRPAPRVPADEPLGPDPTGRTETAFATVRTRLADAAAAAGGTAREVLEATADMAGDPLLIDGARGRIDSGTPPARAVHEATEEVCAMLERVGGLMAERVTDVRSVGHRVIAELLGLPAPGLAALTEPAVVVAEDLAPADTAGLDPALLLALVTERGGPTGHTAIIAGQLGIPCVVQVTGATTIPDGARVAVDAATGEVVVDPDAALVTALADRARALAELAGDRAPGATADGHRVELLANIGGARDTAAMPGAGAEGVGLFRTEVLYLDRAQEPTVEEQAAAYAEVFAAVAGKTVVRTLDAGADKPIPFIDQGAEENPALGVRGYRLVRGHAALLDGQLAAVALAARRTGVEPWVMAPMISVPGEAAEFAARARAAGIVTVGAMVEVPATALMIEEVLEPLDFVSLGTNDLAQYTMGADRLLDRLSDLLDPWQPAVLRLIARTAAAGRDAGKPVGVCGESAADPAMALVLAGLGVTSLSMSPGALPEVRAALRGHAAAHCRELAEAAVGARDAAGARAGVISAMDDRVRRTLALTDAG